MKGIRRQTMLLRTPDSRYFEEAQFILRADFDAYTEADGSDGEEGEMLREANRILEETGFVVEMPKRRKKGKKLSCGVAMLLGGLCGGSAVGLCWLFLSIL